MITGFTAAAATDDRLRYRLFSRAGRCRSRSEHPDRRKLGDVPGGEIAIRQYNAG